MALISTSGIQALQVIKSDHVLRIINALSGVVNNDILILGDTTVSGSSNLKLLYAPSMVGPTSFTGSFTATHTTNNQYAYAIYGQNITNSGSGVYGSSQSGIGVYAGATGGTGLYAYSYSGTIARFISNTGYEKAKIFNNGNFLLNSLDTNDSNQADTGYKLYVGGNTYITGSFNVTGSTSNWGFPHTVLLQNPTGSSGAVLELRNTSGSISPGHTLGTIQFSGLAGGGNYASSQIRATAYQTPSSGNPGGGILSFWTGYAGYTNPLERMRINQDGYVGIGTTTPTDTLTVQGTTKISGSLVITGSFIPPVYTSASRAALVAPATGSVVYQSDSITGLYVYKGNSPWINLTSAEIYTFLHGSQTPTANNTYYIGNFPDTGTPQSSTDVRGRIIAQHTGVAVSFAVANYMGTGGTAETATLTLNNITKGTSITITNAIKYDIPYLTSYTLASPFAITEGDILQVQWTTPAWVTAPISVRHRLTMKTLVIG